MSNLNDVRELKTEVTTINGDKMYLFYDMNAFAEIEEKYKTLDKAFEALSSGRVKPLIEILRIGLSHDNENITTKEVGKLFVMASDVVAKMTTAIVNALPKKDKADATRETDEKNAQNPTAE
jgi:hypothetical protein